MLGGRVPPSPYNRRPWYDESAESMESMGEVPLIGLGQNWRD